MILRGMRHHPVLTGTSPFRIHPGDAPFVEPDMPWPSPNNRAAADAVKAGTPWPPYHFDRRPRTFTVGPMVDEPHTMVRFVAETNVDGTDASYHLPAFYELWARSGPAEDRGFWARAADASRSLFTVVADPRTGLAPDRSHCDGSTMPMRGGKPDPFGYDSWRTVSNWSVDYAWWGKDAREQARLAVRRPQGGGRDTVAVGEGLAERHHGHGRVRHRPFQPVDARDRRRGQVRGVVAAQHARRIAERADHRDALSGLDDATVVDLFRQGYLQLAYTVIGSLQHVGRLAGFHNDRLATAA